PVTSGRSSPANGSRRMAGSTWVEEEHHMLSSWDDYPVHQVAETIRHVGTSDRNFYDRYYFNLHGSSSELFMVMGLGQYPNLGVKAAFPSVTRGGSPRVVRPSRELRDPIDTRLG